MQQPAEVGHELRVMNSVDADDVDCLSEYMTYQEGVEDPARHDCEGRTQQIWC